MVKRKQRDEGTKRPGPGYKAVCRVCSDDLALFSEGGVHNKFFKHVSAIHAGVADPHRPRPRWVRAPKVCDFCAGLVDPPVWEYIARPVPAGALVIQNEAGEIRAADGQEENLWLACAPCAELIEANQQTKLLIRYKRMIRDHDGAVAEVIEHTMVGAVMMQRQFFESYTGVRRPFVEDEYFTT